MKITFTIILLTFTMTINLIAQQGWQYQNSNLTTNEYGAICAINKDTVFVIADNGIFNKTYNGGLTWNVQNTGFTVSFFDLSFYNLDTGYAVGQNGTIIKTINGGTNWTLLTSGTNKDLFSIYIKAPNNIWAVGDSGVILNSIDFGLTWNNDSLLNKRLNSIAFKGNMGIIVGNSGTLLKSLNNGTNWTIENSTTTNDLYSLFITQNYAYALSGWISDEYFDAYELLKTTDYSNWTTIYSGSGMPGLSKIIFVNDSVGFNLSSNCTTNGDCGIIIRKTEDNANNWDQSFENWNPPAGWVGIGYSDIAFINDTIGYALCGNNILKTTDGGQWVNMKDLNYNKLFKIYPNPVTSDVINIEFSNFALTNLTIEISDIKGMSILSKKVSNITEHVNLLHIDKGVYFVKLLQENKIIEVHKLIKLK